MANHSRSELALPAANLLLACWSAKLAFAPAQAGYYFRMLDQQIEKFRTTPELVQDQAFATELQRFDRAMPVGECHLTRILGGPEVLTILREAQRIEGVRVVTESLGRERERGELFALDPKLADELKSMFGQPETYAPSGSICGFRPSAKFVFHHGKLGTLELLLCLHCADLRIAREGQLIRGSFNGRRREVAELMIKIFPDHRDVEELLREK